jgi:hypothetical protein
MSSFFSRKCGRPQEEVTTTEKVVGVAILLALAALCGAVVVALTVHGEGEKPVAVASAASKPAGPAVEPPPAAAVQAKAFALPGLDRNGWAGPDQVQTFTGETVHQKINGRDGIYLAYGIVTMTFGTYKRSGQEDRYVDAFVYDMGRTLNAFGCYRAEYAEGMPAAQVGRAGYRAERSLFFWKGGCYVQLVAGDGVAKDDDPLITDLAQQIAARIPDDGAGLWGDELLPKAGRKPGALGYERVNAFSLDFLRDVFRADYTDGKATYTLFVHRAPSAEAARQVLDQYAAYLGRHGKVLSRQDSPGGQTLVGEATGMFDVVFCKGSTVGGVNGADDRKLAERQGMAFRDTLK